MSDFTSYGSNAKDPSFRSWHAPTTVDDPTPCVPAANEPTPAPPEPDIEELLAAEYERGKRETEAALAAEREQLTQTVASLRGALDGVSHTRGELVAASADQIGAIVNSVTRRVLDRSLAYHPDALPHLIRQTVMQMPTRDEITVSLSPTAANALPKHFADELGVRVLVDANAGTGCVVASPAVTIEATTDAMIEAVDEAVKNWINSQSSLTAVSRRDAS
jgi:flagellar biosynthesis/type III secretory pathway protein FliH